MKVHNWWKRPTVTPEPTEAQLDFCARYANELEDLGVSNAVILEALQRASFKARRATSEEP